jgi:hypothetical protein
LLVKLTQIPLTPSPPCAATLEVVADPAVASEQIEVVDCEDTTMFASGGVMRINANANCICYIGTEESSWTRLKALYR